MALMYIPTVFAFAIGANAECELAGNQIVCWRWG
jgi:hypothetical protein